MNDFDKFKMNIFETYSFPRLVRTQSLEFFFIRGVNEARNFFEYWDGRLIEVLGYLVIYTDVQTNEQTNLIYLIEDDNKNFQEIIRYTKNFASEMCTTFTPLDMMSFTIQKTTVYQRGLDKQEIVDFIKKIVKQDIPKLFLDEIF
ncbi:hypothetical protein PB01_15300 [Psychrobacillus glaciei]|uniref:Uncharacterized protein n=1 Tax=Psychrobacillus glaciei TaxID=2283160 RepID=A0A5J6SQ67_9BACI|nr:hypothetical protein [Psychrobacillus glaciei]QFG00082.1 hypothetical protein PB01_15300 [Psychrobacillus glaciei]